MDTQISILLNIHNGYVNQEKKCIINPSIQDKENLFEFKEYDSVTIAADLKEDICIYVETPQKTLCLTKEKSTGEISKYDSSDQSLLYVPGYYQLIVESHNIRKNYQFRVLPNNMRLESFLLMNDYIEAFQLDLSRELYANKRLDKYGNVLGESDFNMYNYIISNKFQLNRVIHEIIADPLSDISKEYSYRDVSKRPDHKTYKKYAQKGISSFNYLMSRQHYEKRVFVNFDIAENRWLYQTIDFLLMYVKRLEHALDNSYYYYSKYKNNCKENLDFAQKKVVSIKLNKFVSMNIKVRWENRVKYLSVENTRFDQALKKISTMKNDICAITRLLSEMKVSEFFTEISNINRPVNVKLRILKDRRYNWLNEFIAKIETFSKQGVEISSYYPLKPSYELFEYYNVLLLISIIQSLDFKWTDGWIADDICIKEELMSGERLIFKRAGERLILDYDREIMENMSAGEAGFISISGRNRKPDIMLSYTNDNNEVRSVVFEVKYRKSCYLFNRNGDTKVVEQMKNYLQFGYYDGENIDRNSVKKVYLLYPEQERLVNYNDEVFKSTLEFLPVVPMKDPSESIYFRKIKSFICELIG